MTGYDKWGRRKGQVEMVVPTHGVADFEAKAIPASKPPKPKPERDTGPLVPMAEKKGASALLKCRTPGEARLVAAQLEREQIIAILPDEKTMLHQYRTNGCVQVQVSAKAYGSAVVLQSVVEFRYWVIRREQPLSFVGKMGAMFLGVMVVPGLLVYTRLRSSYITRGYERMAREFKLWLFLGVLSLVVSAGLATLCI
jgi:hypothetical protein